MDAPSCNLFHPRPRFRKDANLTLARLNEFPDTSLPHIAETSGLLDRGQFVCCLDGTHVAQTAGHIIAAVNPPSTVRTLPVMNDASLEARNRAA